MKEQKLFEKVGIKLSPAQLLEKGKQLAEKQGAITKLEDEKSEAMKGFNDKIHALEAESDELTREINSEHSEQDIQIVEEPEDGRKLMLVKEAETGRVLRTRKMTLEEIADSEARLNGIDVNGARDTEPAPSDDEKPKGKRGRRAAAAETNEELGD